MFVFKKSLKLVYYETRYDWIVYNAAPREEVKEDNLTSKLSVPFEFFLIRC